MVLCLYYAHVYYVFLKLLINVMYLNAADCYCYIEDGVRIQELGKVILIFAVCFISCFIFPDNPIPYITLGTNN